MQNVFTNNFGFAAAACTGTWHGVVSGAGSVISCMAENDRNSRGTELGNPKPNQIIYAAYRQGRALQG